eukprot:CAMPEP_0116946560 /NCGR_PEP_ID=MMETSP0467-20121206/37073_1 /TAXON_ID=283647 /ORGANISM="Mesodinium pulex, Strain SPMC105" /LENGTH=52 /DNA_ID=CAMNT_0004630391 /DNA_START=123 /DNA_END=281 /DNA_ORIENTATION=+
MDNGDFVMLFGSILVEINASLKRKEFDAHMGLLQDSEKEMETLEDLILEENC